MREVKKLTKSQGEQDIAIYNREKEGKMDWSYLVEELTSKTRYRRKGRRKDISERKRSNKMYATTG